MRRLGPPMLAVVAMLPGCRGGGGGPDLAGVMATRYEVPGEATELGTFVCRDRDGGYAYAVLQYGWFQELIDWPGGRANPGQVGIGGRAVSVPQDGAVYVVDPDLGLHRLDVTAEALRAQLPESPGLGKPNPGGFFESRLWREELLPVLKQHEWRRPKNDKP